jgi:hypothetical protein
MEGQMTETSSHVPWQTYNPPLEPTTQEFVDGVTICNSQISELTVGAARAALVAMQAKPTGKPTTLAQTIVAPVGPKGFVNLHLVRPTKFPMLCLSSCSSTEEDGPSEMRPPMIVWLASLL